MHSSFHKLHLEFVLGHKKLATAKVCITFTHMMVKPQAAWLIELISCNICVYVCLLPLSLYSRTVWIFLIIIIIIKRPFLFSF